MSPPAFYVATILLSCSASTGNGAAVALDRSRGPIVAPHTAGKSRTDTKVTANSDHWVAPHQRAGNIITASLSSMGEVTRTKLNSKNAAPFLQDGQQLSVAAATNVPPVALANIGNVSTNATGNGISATLSAAVSAILPGSNSTGNSTATATAESEKKKDPVEEAVSGGSSLLQLIILVVFAMLYKSKVVDQIPKLQPKQANSAGKEFKNGLCGCFSNMHLCLHTTCCWNARAAHTWTVAGDMEYWNSILLTVCCSCFMPCIGGIWLRSKVRTTLGLEPDSFMDCLKWCCCTPCAIGQEAMDVDEESGVNVKCCFNIDRGGLATNEADPEP